MAPKKDFTQVALDVVRRATGEVSPPEPTPKQAAGRTGGLKGGVARAAKLTPEQRAEIAKKAAAGRWKKTYRNRQRAIALDFSLRENLASEQTERQWTPTQKPKPS
jgi:hypothetical protein